MRDDLAEDLRKKLEGLSWLRRWFERLGVENLKWEPGD